MINNNNNNNNKNRNKNINSNNKNKNSKNNNKTTTNATKKATTTRQLSWVVTKFHCGKITLVINCGRGSIIPCSYSVDLKLSNMYNLLGNRLVTMWHQFLSVM